MKIYIQKICKKYNMLLNLIIAILITSLVIYLFEMNYLKNLLLNHFTVVSLLTSLVILGKYLLVILKCQNKKVAFVDYFATNSLVYSFLMIIYFLLEKSQYDGIYFFVQGIHIVVLILNLLILYTRVNVVKSNSKKHLESQTNTIINDIKYELGKMQNEQSTIINNEISRIEAEVSPSKASLEPLTETLDEQESIEKNNLLTEALQIDEEMLNNYYKIVEDVFSKNEIDYSFKGKNKTSLIDILKQFESENALLEFINNNINLFIDASTLNLNQSDLITLTYLFNIYPNLRNEILTHYEYYILNDQSSFLNKQKIQKTSQYTLLRKEYFDSIESTYPKALDILQNVYQEVANYLNDKVSKKIIKNDSTNAESLSTYDLYLKCFNFDYLKARRQVTKFIEEYNNQQTPAQATKVFKDFIDEVLKTEYAPTAFSYLATLKQRITNKSWLILDIAKKSSLYQTKDQLLHNTLNKAVFATVIYLNELDEQEIEKTLKRLYAKNEDIVFIERLTNAIIEFYGYSSTCSLSAISLLNNSLLQFINKYPNYLSNKNYSNETMQIIIYNLKDTSEFKTFIENNINIDTINRLCLAFTITEKNKNTYHYILDSKTMNQFINKTEAVKLMKQKEESSKQNIIINLVKNKDVVSRVNLDPKKL